MRVGIAADHGGHTLKDQMAESLRSSGYDVVDVGAQHAKPNDDRTVDADTTPRSIPELYQCDLNMADIAEVWRRGSVVSSWLLDLAVGALIDSPDLEKFAGRVSDSGEERWTIDAAIDKSVPVPVLSDALYERFNSRGDDDFAEKSLSAHRYGFGGHKEKSAVAKGIA